ncbi:MAG: hypothetical protein IJY16_00335 [Clostridia bacterium]|nr:hypothetical protein [Clostridia bacterium]
MRKTVIPTLLIFLVLLLLLTCTCMAMSDFPMSEMYYWSWQEYESLLEQDEIKIHEDFIYYNDIAAIFGEFCGYRLDVIFNKNIPLHSFYYVMDENQVVFRVRADKSGYKPGGGENSSLEQITDMRDLRGTAYEEEERSHLTVDGFSFEYKHGQLDHIEFGYGDWYVVIAVEVGRMGFSDYPHLGEDTLMMRLLNPETTAAAIREIYTRIDSADAGMYKEPFSLSDWLQKPPVLVGIGAVFGAVVATLITFLVMRKKRGKLAPATAGAPAGEVLAGSDGDASAASSGVAPASPESPTPPESPAAPESPAPPEAAATDDPSKNE